MRDRAGLTFIVLVVVSLLGVPAYAKGRPQRVKVGTETIVGSVVDESGHPIVGAWVQLVNRDLLSPPNGDIDVWDDFSSVAAEAYSMTDNDGGFKFTHLRYGKTEIAVYSNGYRTETLADVAAGAKGVKIRLAKAKPYALSGLVVNTKDSPLPEVEVVLVEKSHKSPRPEPKIVTVRTAAGGKFFFPGKLQPLDADGNVWRSLIARKEGYSIWYKWLDSTGAEPHVTIKLLPASRLSGKVLVDDDRPLLDAAVWVNTMSMPGQRPDSFFLFDSKALAPKTKTNKNGEFTLDGLPPGGMVSLRASFPGYVEGEGCRLSMKTGSTDVELRLEQEAILRGKVVYEETGKPVPGMRIGTQAHETSRGTKAETDDQGRFELRGVAPEPCNVLLRLDDPKPGKLPDWTAAAIVINSLAPGQIVDDLEIVLTKGGVICGRVVDALGKPLQNINIGFTSPARPSLGAAIDAVDTAQDGSWTCRVPPGKIHVFIRTEIPRIKWAGESNYAFDLKHGQVIENVNFVLSQKVPGNSPYKAF